MNRSATLEKGSKPLPGVSTPQTSWLRRTFSRWTVLDNILVWIVAACGVLAALATLVAPKFLIPAEDAVILFQYSRNLATTNAITYIAQGPHAEGATDFLWMVLISLSIKLHANPMWIVATMNLLSLVVIAYFLLRMAGARIHPLAIAFLAGATALFPQFYAALLGFSVLPFAALLLAFVSSILEENAVATPLLALALCLFRPDGVVFALPLLFSSLLFESERSKRVILDVLLFILPGLIYFLWRWHYFHEFLPLPFLVKSDTQRVAHLFVPRSFDEAKPLLVFTFVVLLVSLHGQWKDRKVRTVLVCVLVLPTIFYLFMRLDQNIGRRFFVYLPLGTAILLAMKWPQLKPRAWALLRTGVIAWAVLICAIWIREAVVDWGYQLDNRKAMAEHLADVPHGTMLVTEAGIAPYYSGWNAYDAWGLNSAEFAQHLLQPADVTRINPDLILVYTNTSVDDCIKQPSWQIPYHERLWTNMTHNIVAGTDGGNYDLRVIPAGNWAYRAYTHTPPWQGKQECWYVRRSSPLHDRIDEVLFRHRAMTYAQYESHEIRISEESSGPKPALKKSTLYDVLTAPPRMALRLWRLIVY
jgi:hypothetical protein